MAEYLIARLHFPFKEEPSGELAYATRQCCQHTKKENFKNLVAAKLGDPNNRLTANKTVI